MKLTLTSTVIISAIAASSAHASNIDYSTLSNDQLLRDHYQEILLGAHDDRLDTLESSTTDTRNTLVRIQNGLLNQIDATNQNVNSNKQQLTQLAQQQGNFVTKPDFDASQKLQDDKTNANRWLINANRTDIDKNTAALAGKVDTTTFNSDQLRQDQEVAGKVDKTDYLKDKLAQDGKIDQNRTDIDNNRHEIDTNSQLIRTTGNQVGQNRNNIAANKAALAGKANQTDLDTEIKARNDGDKALQTNIDDNRNEIDTNAQLIRSMGGQVGQNRNNIAANKASLAGKVDTITYDAGQKVQDDKLTDHDKRITENFTNNLVQEGEIHKNTLAGLQRDTRMDGIDQTIATETSTRDAQVKHLDTVKADKADVDANKADINANKTAIAGKVDTKVFTDDQDRQDKVIAGKADAATVLTNSRQIAADEKEEQQHFTTLSAGVKQAQDTGAYAQSRADAAYANTEANHKALEATNKTVAAHTAELADHEQRITALEQDTNQNFGKLKDQVDSNRKRASAGIAGVAAIATIPQVIESQTFNVGVGVGNTDGENALAVGFSARASQHVVVKAAVSNDTQHNFVVGGGVAVGW